MPLRRRLGCSHTLIMDSAALVCADQRTAELFGELLCGLCGLFTGQNLVLQVSFQDGHLRRLFDTYAPRGCQFLAVYLLEAHARDEWPLGTSRSDRDQHRSETDRQAAVRSVSREENVTNLWTCNVTICKQVGLTVHVPGMYVTRCAEACAHRFAEHCVLSGHF